MSDDEREKSKQMNTVKSSPKGPPKKDSLNIKSHGTPANGNEAVALPSSGRPLDFAKLLAACDVVSNRYKFVNKKELYDQRDKIQRDLELICDGLSAKQTNYVVASSLESAAKKGGAPKHIQNEIDLMHKSGHDGMTLFHELIQRYGKELPAPHIELLSELKDLNRTKGMTLRECINRYDDILERMKKEDVKCVPSNEVLGAKLISFI